MRRMLLGLLGLSLLVLAGCGETTDRLKRVDVDGVDCIVATNRIGRPQALDCDFPEQ